MVAFKESKKGWGAHLNFSYHNMILIIQEFRNSILDINTQHTPTITVNIFLTIILSR